MGLYTLVTVLTDPSAEFQGTVLFSLASLLLTLCRRQALALQMLGELAEIFVDNSMIAKVISTFAIILLPSQFETYPWLDMWSV